MSQSPVLWSVDELVAATRGTLDGANSEVPVTGISIDTRTIRNGDLFVALQDQRDGHDFVSAAFAKGAAIALVNLDYRKQGEDGLLLRVGDPLLGLEKLAAAARARLRDKARVIAVTGSAGKTTTKEMMRLGYAHMGLVHASEKSYNNHWGVPLTLARMPRETDFAIIEIGMNHTGEIRPLTKMARPHIAVVTSVLPVHLEHFSGVEGIAEAKAEIFEGLIEQGWALIPRDTPQFELLAQKARALVGEHISSFGEHADADNIVKDIELGLAASNAALVSDGHDRLAFDVGLPGRHNVLNAAACITAWFCAVDGLDMPRTGQEIDGVLKALASMHMEPAGRGQVFELDNLAAGSITLIDESYNANPASMRAAFENMSLYPGGRRKVAVIGDMLELGKSADELHIALVEPLKKAGINSVFACGAHMKKLFETLPENLRGGYEVDASALKPLLLQGVKDGDIIMIKGSFGSHMGSLVEALKDGRLVESKVNRN